LDRPDPEPNPAPPLDLRARDDVRDNDFYELVAEAWLWLTATATPGSEQSPVERLASVNEKKAATVYGWLHEARSRGLLVAPAARSSKRQGRFVPISGPGTRRPTKGEPS
jgi:hypothetical protein